jgi:hypothetical protein
MNMCVKGYAGLEKEKQVKHLQQPSNIFCPN